MQRLRRAQRAAHIILKSKQPHHQRSRGIIEAAQKEKLVIIEVEPLAKSNNHLIVVKIQVL